MRASPPTPWLARLSTKAGRVARAMGLGPFSVVGRGFRFASEPDPPGPLGRGRSPTTHKPQICRKARALAP